MDSLKIYWNHFTYKDTFCCCWVRFMSTTNLWKLKGRGKVNQGSNIWECQSTCLVLSQSKMFEPPRGSNSCFLRWVFTNFFLTFSEKKHFRKHVFPAEIWHFCETETFLKTLYGVHIIICHERSLRILMCF